MFAASSFNINDLGLSSFVLNDLRALKAESPADSSWAFFFSSYFYCTCFGEILGQEQLSQDRSRQRRSAVRRSASKTARFFAGMSRMSCGLMSMDVMLPAAPTFSQSHSVLPPLSFPNVMAQRFHRGTECILALVKSTEQS